MFVCGAVVGAVKPSVRPCVEGRGEDECGECDALCGETDDEEGSKGVHDFFSFFVFIFQTFRFSCCVRAGGARERTAQDRFLWGLPRPVPGGCNPHVRKQQGRSVECGYAVCPVSALQRLR